MKSRYTISKPQAATQRRACLACGRRFTAEGRFTRLCQPCRQAATAIAREWVG